MPVMRRWTLRGAPERAGDPGRPMCVAGPLVGPSEEIEVVPASQLRGAVDALRALEHGWKHFYDHNVGAWEREHDEPLTLANYVRHHLRGQS